MRRVMVSAFVAMSMIGTPALAKADNANLKSANAASAPGKGCSSAGATADNPGQWLQELREHPLLEGLTPAEMAEKENTSSGWEGYGQTNNVGEFIRFFCGE